MHLLVSLTMSQILLLPANSNLILEYAVGTHSGKPSQMGLIQIKNLVISLSHSKRHYVTVISCAVKSKTFKFFYSITV